MSQPKEEGVGLHTKMWFIKRKGWDKFRLGRCSNLVVGQGSTKLKYTTGWWNKMGEKVGVINDGRERTQTHGHVQWFHV